MGQCACHSDIETPFLCMKYNRYLCEKCLKCQDPHIYCKFRTSCPIWFLQKTREGWEDEAQTSGQVPDQRVAFQVKAR